MDYQTTENKKMSQKRQKIAFENVSDSSKSDNSADSFDDKSEVYKVDKYKTLSQLEHILTLPDTYIGSIERYDKDSLIYDHEQKKIIYKKVRQPEGQERIFLEIASNAGDNVQRSRESKVSFGNVIFKFTDKTVEVINGGNMIPIEKNSDGMWIPELIFGTLLTSSNYDQDEEKRVCGRNGLGAKLCNAWSTFFSIQIHNANQGKEFYQEWRNNMSEKSEPIVKAYSRKTNIMSVKFQPDFKRIYKNDKETPQTSFSKEDIQIFMKHCIDLSFSCNVKVIIDVNCPELDMVYNETVNPGINIYIKHIFPTEKNIIYENNFMECAIIDASEELVHEKLLNISFVNGITTKTGTHITTLNSKVAQAIFECIQSLNIIKDSEKLLSKLRPRDVVSNICIISSFRLVNPKFSSQTKENLTSQIPNFQLKPEFFMSIKKWKLIDHIMNTIENKLEREVSKTDGKKKKHVKIDSLEDANWAGSSRSKECTLYLLEGDSAMAYAVKYISYTKDGRNTQGCLPLRGKPLNAIKASISDIGENKVFNNIKTALGLREGLNYLDEDNFNTLRYGKIVILSDADNDGKHIAGLVLVYFYSRYKTLLERGCIEMLRTPIVRIKKGSNLKFFYSERSIKEEDLKGGVARYCKGLGSSTDEDIKQDVVKSKFIKLDMDEQANRSLLLAFDEKNSDDRKPWIVSRISIQDSEKLDIDNYNPYPISHFVNEEVVEYSIENLQRAIPSLIDGLKDSQRKALYGGFKKFKKNTPPLKVAQFAGMISSITDYKHGEKSMEDTIVGMAESYTGSNNLAYFSEVGQFGCVDPNTKILTWDGKIKLAKEITENDILIGDDGTPRNISKVVKGYDDMYEVQQQYGENYIVNSLHILTLKFISHKKVYKDDKFGWTLIYFDDIDKQVKYKSVDNLNMSEQEAISNISEFSKNIQENNIFDINIKQFLSFNPKIQRLFNTVYNKVPIKWGHKNCNTDPYDFGYLIFDDKYIDKYLGINIPNEYVYNDEENRLKLLAGVIDKCGFIKFKGTPSEVFKLSKPYGLYGNIIYKLEFISKSLGYKTKVEIEKDRKTGDKIISLIINGNLSKIPTKLPRKQSTKLSENNKNININIKHIGKGEYVGWYLDGNERFLLGDFTVTHNTRNMLGEDCASSRYIFTNLRNWVFDCFIEQDFDILEHVYVNGEECEYKYFLPIIPMHLINGACGIATGFSTKIPQYSPYDIIKWLSTRIKKGEPLEKNEVLIKPWYAGFKGEIIMNNDGTKYNTKGILKRSRDSWIVEEIPITNSIHKYKNFLDELVECKDITDYSNLSQPNSPMFVIKTQNIIDENLMNLTSKHSLSNLVLLDESNIPILFENVHDILEKWYLFRLNKYDKRKENEIRKMKDYIAKLNMKIKFIDLVLQNKIVIFKQKKEEILKSMRDYEVDEDLIRMPIHSFTQDEIDSLLKLRNDKQEYLDNYINTKIEQIWMMELLNLLQTIKIYYNETFDTVITENKSIQNTKTNLTTTKRRGASTSTK